MNLLNIIGINTKYKQKSKKTCKLPSETRNWGQKMKLFLQHYSKEMQDELDHKIILDN